MSYNLLSNTSFKTDSNWEYINCSYKDGKIISSKKVFGIKQTLILPDPTKLYFRCNYNILNSNIEHIKIGIQNHDILNVDTKKPKKNKNQYISVIDIAKQEKISVHLIFESIDDINEIEVKEPLLVDLNHFKQSTWLKIILDRSINYIPGYTYINEYCQSEIKSNLEDFKNANLEDAKVGSIIKSKETIKFDISAKFIINHYYLVKLDLDEINTLGEIYFKFGVLKSTKINGQLYLIFKITNIENQLQLVVAPNDVLEYAINIKHLLLIDITKMKLLKDDIPYLPFI